MTASVLVPLAEGCEELEAVIIIDLLRRAGIEVVSASLHDAPITASRGVRLIADTTLEAVMDHDFDMIVLPGGMPGSDHLNADPRIHQLLKSMAQKGKYTAAICAAPKVLASAGLLEGKRATSYPGVLDGKEYAGFDYINSPVVRDGTVMTSMGPGTAMDFALELIETLAGKETKELVEKGLVRS